MNTACPVPNSFGKAGAVWSEVLAQVRLGRTNAEIARKLGISVATVNKHVQHVLKKLKVRNRAQAATIR